MLERGTPGRDGAKDFLRTRRGDLIRTSDFLLPKEANPFVPFKNRSDSAVTSSNPTSEALSKQVSSDSPSDTFFCQWNAPLHSLRHFRCLAVAERAFQEL
jgi:hypothetical protein